MEEREFSRDPLTGRWLRGMEDPRPRSEEEWVRLGRRLRRAARGRLALLRGKRSWWEETAAWTGSAIPVGLAAAIAALLLLFRAGAVPLGAGNAGVAVTADSSASVAGFLTALTQEQGEPELADAAVGPLSTDWFLQTAVAQ